MALGAGRLTLVADLWARLAHASAHQIHHDEATARREACPDMPKRHTHTTCQGAEPEHALCTICPGADHSPSSQSTVSDKHTSTQASVTLATAPTSLHVHMQVPHAAVP
jgi:hypothetical protein